MKSLALTVALSCCLALSGLAHAAAADKPATAAKQDPAIKQLLADVKVLVTKHYPQAKFRVTGRYINFEHATEVVKLPAIVKTPAGKKPPIVDERSPKSGGVWCSIGLHSGRAAVHPRIAGTSKRGLFNETIIYPENKKKSRHLVVELRLPEEPQAKKFRQALAKTLQIAVEKLPAVSK